VVTIPDRERLAGSTRRSLRRDARAARRRHRRAEDRERGIRGGRRSPDRGGHRHWGAGAFSKQADILRQLAIQLNVGEDAILAQVEKLSQTAKQLEKELEAQKRKGR